MLKKIIQAILKPNHQPEMFESKATTNPFAQATGEALASQLIDRFWVKNKAANDSHEKLMVTAIAEKMMQDCHTVFSSSEPIMINRRLLADSVLRCAKMQVLLISPAPEPDGTGLRGHFGITGELKTNILDIVKIDQEFKNFPEGLNFDKTWNQIQYAYRRAWACMNVFEGLRHEYGDINPEQSDDWFRPFFASQCAYAESQYREELGMVNVIDQGNNVGSTSGLSYGDFREIVLQGDRFPDATWEGKYPHLVNPKTIWAS